MEDIQEMKALRRRLAELEGEVSGLRETERALRESEAKYRLIADHSGDCIWIVDLASLRFTYVSPAVFHIYGSTVEETLAQTVGEVMPPESFDLMMKVFEEELEIEAAGTANPERSRTVEVEEYRKDRSRIWIENVLSFLRDEKNRPVAVLGVSRDMTERKRLEAELRHLAVTDPLTGAANRRHFMEALQREAGRSNRYAYPFSLIMLDIDHFKAVNDRFGHEAGDRVLAELADLIRKRIRSVDLLSRWGGEEFLILLVNTALPQALTLAEALLERMKAIPFPGIGRVTASFGVTSYRSGERIDALLTRVDDLLYQAKREGRARIAQDPSPP